MSMASLKFTNLLNAHQIEFFKKYSDEHTYNNLTQIIYRGQVPMAAYLLLEGKVTLKDAQKRVIEECSPNPLIGYSEIHEDKSFRYTAEISPNSKVLILPRSAMFEIKEYCENNQLCPKMDLSKLKAAAV